MNVRDIMAQLKFVNVDLEVVVDVGGEKFPVELETLKFKEVKAVEFRALLPEGSVVLRPAPCVESDDVPSIV